MSLIPKYENYQDIGNVLHPWKDIYANKIITDSIILNIPGNPRVDFKLDGDIWFFINGKTYSYMLNKKIDESYHLYKDNEVFNQYVTFKKIYLYENIMYALLYNGILLYYDNDKNKLALASNTKFKDIKNDILLDENSIPYTISTTNIIKLSEKPVVDGIKKSDGTYKLLYPDGSIDNKYYPVKWKRLFYNDYVLSESDFLYDKDFKQVFPRKVIDFDPISGYLIDDKHHTYKNFKFCGVFDHIKICQNNYLIDKNYKLYYNLELQNFDTPTHCIVELNNVKWRI